MDGQAAYAIPYTWKEKSEEWYRPKGLRDPEYSKIVYKEDAVHHPSTASLSIMNGQGQHHTRS